MRRKSFYGEENTLMILLNPVKATSTDTCDTIAFGKEEVVTRTEVAEAIGRLESGKTPGED